MSRRLPLLLSVLGAAVFLAAGRAGAQTPTPTPSPTPTPTPEVTQTTVPSGASRLTENGHAVTGVRITPMPDGTVWFLVPSNDRIVQLQADGVTLKQWQIRPDTDIGANPVDFQVDGDVIWFIENGESSQINAGYSAFGRLDTVSGELTEWVLPSSRPAGFWRAPDGHTVWIPQSNGRLQALDLNSPTIVDYKSTETFAYADMVLGPDGALWLADFGNNRIVRYVPGDTKETSWTYFDVNTARLNPSQIKFDERGILWISELSGNRMDAFDPSSNSLTEYSGFNFPIHFDIFNDRIYVAEADGANGAVNVLDPALASATIEFFTPEILDVHSTVNLLPVTTMSSTIVPTMFTTVAVPFVSTDFSLVPGLGTLETTFNNVNAYGISAQDGGVWVGSEGKIVRLTIQDIGSAADLTVPVSIEHAAGLGQPVHIDVTLSNRDTAAISGNVLFLYSPAAYSPSAAFTLTPGQTLVLPDAFASVASAGGLTISPIRVMVTSGNAANLLVSARSNRVLDDGSTLGFSLPAQSGTDALSAGSSRTLFLGSGAATDSVLGFFAPAQSSAALTLLAPDGTVRGTRALMLDTNVSLEFNPAASAFGVAEEDGDVVRVTVNSGSLQPYVDVLDTGSGDVAQCLPLTPTTDAVLPGVRADAGDGTTSLVSDLYLSNASTVSAAQITVTYFPPTAGAKPSVAVLTLAPNASRIVSDVLPTLFNVTSGQGALQISSSQPVACALRAVQRMAAGDTGAFVGAIGGTDSIPDAGTAVAFEVPQTATRQTDLLLFNRGAAGNATVIGYDSGGNEIGRLVVPLSTDQPVRLVAVFSQLGVTSQTAGSLKVQTSSGMQVYAQTEVIDASGDRDITPLR